MLTSGTLLGERYEIIEKIGAGGMSIVYKAKDNRLQRYVAIKELREEFVQDEEFVGKFRKEALSAASLSHPNIVGIYDVGSDKEVHYIVMEYVEGKTLKQVIAEEGPFDAKTVLELGVQMVSALKHAHQKKIIHRDIKPQNILITSDGVLKVTDFGIAKAVDSSTIVASGNAIGSVHYFSPEQAKGKYVNESSDLYSCGIVLFELATKRLPFEADSHISIALKHINEEFPRPSSINPGIPENLENIILHATCKNQVDRYQNADEMLRDMRGVLQNPNYVVGLANLTERTILLSTEETQILRESGTDDNHEEYQDYGTEGIQEGEALVSSKDDEQIYESNVDFDDQEDESGEVSTFYKVIVSMGGILATLALVIVITLACVFWIPSITKGKTFSVPSVVEKTQEIAEKLLKKNNLEVKVIEVETDEVKAGTVIEQSPVPGTAVKKGTIVEIQVAVSNEDEEDARNEEVTVPYLTGLTINEVTMELSKAGLHVGKIVYEASNLVEQNEVIRQSPKAGEIVKDGAEIDLVINGEEREEEERTEGIEVPNLYGKTVEEARRTLGGMNLSLGSQSEEASEEPKGTIIRQTVSVGSTVEPGTRINVTVSKGPKQEEVSPEPSEAPEESTTPEETPTQTPEETLQPEETNQPQESVTTTQNVAANLPADMAGKESYHVVAKLTLDDGTSQTQEADVTPDKFPYNFSFQGEGTGVVNIFIDGVSTSQDPITF
ncbi:MAG: Stk1 family PASTA domain-containing Ser/Thr kinase [Cellulosilyticum sp.]|nr:Stk1 family PASTA domain-containing Ser/Thr kinase [Cellulosilyticum sp.]